MIFLKRAEFPKIESSLTNAFIFIYEMKKSLWKFLHSHISDFILIQNIRQYLYVMSYVYLERK